MIQLHIMTLAIDLGIEGAAVFVLGNRRGGASHGLLQCRSSLYCVIKTLAPQMP